MARKKTRTNAKPARKSGLVGTQREVIDALKTKGDVAELAAKLAGRHGTPEQQALGVTEIEALRRDEIEALAAGLAVRPHARKRVHLSELGGWPVCWADEKREQVEPLELLVTPITTNAGAVTCRRCKKAADLPSPVQTAAQEEAEAEPVQASKAKRRAAKGKGVASGRAKRRLVLKKNLTVRLKIKGLEVRGVVRPDGSMSVRGTSYDSPHAAANELARDLVNYRIDGFQAWRFQDAEGRWRMLRDHA